MSHREEMDNLSWTHRVVVSVSNPLVLAPSLLSDGSGRRPELILCRCVT